MSDIEAHKATLQIPHVCCACGTRLATDTNQVCAVVPLQLLSGMLTAIRIAWCSECWVRVSLDSPVRDMTIR